MFGRGVAALLAGKQFPRWHHAELCRSSPILVLRGSFRPRFRSGVLGAVRLIHLSTHMGSGVPRDAVCTGGGASACRGSPACTFARVFGHESGGQRSCAHGQGTGKVERGSGEVVLRCRGVAMVERRRCQPTARNPRTRRGRRKGKQGTAWSLPPREAVAVHRSQGSAVSRRN